MDNRFAHVMFALPATKIIRFQFDEACALNTNKGSFRPVGHSRVVGVGHKPSEKQ